MALKGNNILIYSNNVAIAGTRTDEIQTECEMLEISSPDTGTWRTYLAGMKGWSISVGFLVSTNSELKKLLQIGTTFPLTIHDRTGTAILGGNAICTKCNVKATRGNLVQGSFSFKGDGELIDLTTTT